MSKKILMIAVFPLLFITNVLFVNADNSFINFDKYGITLKKGEISAIRVNVVDSLWNQTTAESNIKIDLLAKYYDNINNRTSLDTTAHFYSSSDGSSEITSVTIPLGQQGVTFYYKTNSSFLNTIIESSYTLTYQKSNNLWINTVFGGIGSSNVHNGDYSINKNLTISGDESAYIDFKLEDSRDIDISYKIMISTSSDRTTAVWTRYGSGIPVLGQMSWNGYFDYYDYTSGYWHNERAPKGTYYVRIQIGKNSSIFNDGLLITIQSLEIKGRVTDYSTGTGIEGVSINAYGPNYSYAITNAQGYYILSGLAADSYFLNFYKEGYASISVSGINSGEIKNVVMRAPSYIKINAQRGVSSTITDMETWGSVQLVSNESSYYDSYTGSLHFSVDVSTSDNGQGTSEVIPKYEIDNTSLYTGGKWTIIEVKPGTYNLTAKLYGYDEFAKTGITVSSGETKEITDVFFSLKKGVYGTVTVPEAVTDSWGAWISIEAIPEGSLLGTFFGSAQIPEGQTSGSYSIMGLSAGNYILKVYGAGYRKKTISITVGENDEIVTAPNITLDTGIGLTGTITVEGDTTDSSLNQYIYGDPYMVYLNAWSPDTYSYGWADISVSKSASVSVSTFSIKGLDAGTYWINSWMYGFELEGAVGWNGVKTTVSDTGGTINLKFKRYSGRIKCKFKVPNDDYLNLKISVNGMNMWAADVSMSNILSGIDNYGIIFDTTTGIMTTPPLGTDFYQIKGEYTNTGLSKTKSVMAVNGQTKETEIDLTAQTYSISGKVSVSKTNPPTGYTDISSLYSMVVDSESVAWSNVEYDVNGTTTSFRVTAIDYSKAEALNTYSGTNISNFKSGIISNDGTYTISGIVPGCYVLKISGFELDNNISNGKETAVAEKNVVVNGSNLTSQNLEISRGYSIKGALKLPTGQTANRTFSINVYKANKFKISNFGQTSGETWSNYAGYCGLFLYDVNSATYEVKGLSPGEYIVAAYDMGYGRQYANMAINVKVESSDVLSQDLSLTQGGKIAFKLRDADSNTVITPQNALKMLPETYIVYAVANPWIDGGWGGLENSKWSGVMPSISISSDTANNIVISFLPQAVYDVTFGQSSYGFMVSANMIGSNSMSNTGGNNVNYAAKTVSSVKVVNGQTTDLGTIDIKQGLTITGVVKDKNGTGLPNIPVIAVPSLSNEWSSELKGFTDINGKYSIVGLNSDNQYYDIIACPRIDPGMLGDYYFFGAGGITYGEKVLSMVKIASASSIDFVLEEAKGSVVGKVTTEDDGRLQNPEDLNIPTAKIFMQKEDTFPRTNPIGDIIVDTEFDGSFSIEALASGTYSMLIISGGYASYSKTVTVADSQVNAGTLQLKRGAKVSGTIKKSNGQNPSTTEVRSIMAASDNFSEILFGSLQTAGEKTVIGYELNGFQPDTNYNIMFLSEGDEMIPASVNYSVPYSTYVKTDYNLVFQVSAPAVFSRSKRSGSQYLIYFELSSALRKSVPDDDVLSKIITLVSGNGTISDRYMAPNRKTLSCIYTAPSGENKFSLKLHGFAKTVDPATGSEFEVNETFEYYAGIGAKNRVKVSNLRGGKITLDGDLSNVQFVPGAFNVGSSTASIYIDFSRADSIDDLKTATGNSAPKLTIKMPEKAYPDKMYSAMSLARASGVNPFSSFYDIMLPQGVSRTLKKDATLTLEYTSCSDPTSLNIYYYDSTNDVYLLEETNKQIDAAAQTISISISHASIFVILQSDVSILQGTSYNGPLFVYNFPNPFNLSSKSITLINAQLSQQNQTITGTMIHYGLPQDVSGDMEIKIYNVAGELIRTITDVSKTGGSHYYIEWDGTNQDGKKAASGVYIARFTVDNKNEKFFKMAVIK